MNLENIAQVMNESWAPLFNDKGWTLTAIEDYKQNVVVLRIQSHHGVTESRLPVSNLVLTQQALIDKLNDFITKAIEAHNRLSEEDVPLFTEKVIGYRGWKFNDWVLAPYNTGPPWRPGVNKATCHRHGRTHIPEHDVPGENCHCGFNAFYEFRHAKTHGNVFGAVVGWGDMRCHPDGWRAEYAEIIGLIQNEYFDLTEIQETYNIPVFPNLHELEIEASKYGSPLPESVRPKENPTQSPSKKRGAYRQSLQEINSQIPNSSHSQRTNEAFAKWSKLAGDVNSGQQASIPIKKEWNKAKWTEAFYQAESSRQTKKRRTFGDLW